MATGEIGRMDKTGQRIQNRFDGLCRLVWDPVSVLDRDANRDWALQTSG